MESLFKSTANRSRRPPVESPKEKAVKAPSPDGLIYVTITAGPSTHSYTFLVRGMLGNISAEARSDGGMRQLLHSALSSKFGATVEAL